MTVLFVSGAEDPVNWVPALRARLPGTRVWTEEDAFDRRAVEVAIVASPPAGALRELPALRLVQSLWMGVESLLADRTLPPGVPVARMVDPGMTAQMPEAALAHVLHLHRGHRRLRAPAASAHAAPVAAAARRAPPGRRARPRRARSAHGGRPRPARVSGVRLEPDAQA